MSSIEHHISKDGSSTLYSKQFEQFYHNPNGAISESRHVFFEQSGFLNFLKNAHTSVTIFEMGFGTGLNFLLLMEYLNKFEIAIPVHFFSVEAIPADPKLIKNINYSDSLEIDFSSNQLSELFSSLKPGWNNYSFPTNPNLKLSLYNGYFEDMSYPEVPIHFFFHDPFSPEANNELWSHETFKVLREFAEQDAVLSTYCAASKARAAMAKASWFVAKTKGALGKREMTVASLNETKLIHLKRVNELRLIERFDNGDFED